MPRAVLERLFLVLLVASLAAFAYHVATRPIETTALAAPAASAGSSGPAQPSGGERLPAPPRLQDLAATLERPLFRADRRPWRPEPAKIAEPGPPRAARQSAPPPVPPPENVRLVGIVERQDGSRTALVRAEGAREGLRLERGATLAGWTVSEIGSDLVMLEAGGRRHRLSLDDAPPAGTTAGRPRD